MFGRFGKKSSTEISQSSSGSGEEVHIEMNEIQSITDLDATQSSQTKILRTLHAEELEDDEPSIPLSERFKKAALPSAITLAANGVGVAATSALYKATPGSYIHPSMYLLFTVFNCLLRLPNWGGKPTDGLNQIIAHCRGALYGIADYTTTEAFIHELAHFMADEAFTQGQASMSFEYTALYMKGNTHTTSTALSTTGEKVGEDAARGIISGAGVGLTLLRDFISLGLAQYVENPEIKAHLRMRVAWKVLLLIPYALSPYYMEPSNSNDFYSLDQKGIPAYASFLAVVGSLLLFQTFLSCVMPCKQTFRQDRTNENEAREDEPSKRMGGP